MTARGRRRLLLALAATFVGVAVAAAAAWYVVGEQRRLARVLTALVAARTELSLTIERASTNGSRLDLSGVRLPPTPATPVDASVRHVVVAGGVLPLVARAGHRFDIVLDAVTIRLPGGGTTPDATNVDALRRALTHLFDWPATLGVRIADGRLLVDGASYRFTGSGEKTADAVVVRTTVADGVGATLFTLTARSPRPSPDAASVGVDATVEPRRLGPLWPAAVPRPGTLTVRADIRLERAAAVAISGRMSAATATTPAVIDIESRYEPAAGQLTVSRYAFGWSDVRLQGTGALRAVDGGLRFDASGDGTIDGRRVAGRLRYELASRAFDGELRVEGFSLRRLAARLGMPLLPADVTAQTLDAVFSGRAGDARPVIQVHLNASSAVVPGTALPSLDATAAIRLALAGNAAGPRVRAVESADVVLSRDRSVVGRLTVRSTLAAALWPLSLELTADDLARAAPLLPVTAKLEGSGALTGELRSTEPLEFRGRVDLDVPSAQLQTPGPLSMTAVRASIPVVWGATTDEAGFVRADRVSGWGFSATAVASTARVVDGRLLMPDVRYAQYGGWGEGWIEAAMDGREVPFRMRLDGERIDLSRAVREIGASMAEITGTAHYVASAQYTRAQGLAAVARIDSDEPGGEVSIEAIERLLESAAVQAESSGVLRQTLQALRVFRYESLAADLRLTRGIGHLDVALRGRKRLGIFPAPVEAINLKNVPLAVVSRALAKGKPE
jgi:hypothetical protein